jgi:hypothetical protein
MFPVTVVNCAETYFVLVVLGKVSVVENTTPKDIAPLAPEEPAMPVIDTVVP